MHEDQQRLNRLRQDALAVFNSALVAVNGFDAVKRRCRRKKNTLYIGRTPFYLNRFQNIFIIGAGKATAHMAAAMESILGETLTGGLIVVKYGHSVPLKKIQTIEAGHPVPDASGANGARQILALAEKATASDLIICLISGGGSALLPLPAPGLTLVDKQQTLNILLECGAAIHEINCLRKHMSAIKGGRLAKTAFPATLVSLMISDVPGDRLDVIASGPTVGDPSTFSDGLAVLTKYHIRHHIPLSVLNHMQNGAAGILPETPDPDDPVFKNSLNLIAASGKDALAAAAKKAAVSGYHTHILGAEIQGDTRAAAHFHTAAAKKIQRTAMPAPAPACLLSGGETTVVIQGKGKGGRNQEFALSAAIDIRDEQGMVILSGGTDGTDGPTDAAGAVVDTRTIEKAETAGLNPEQFLDNNDAYHFFKKTGDLLITGPTGTNVMDIRVVMVGEGEAESSKVKAERWKAMSLT